MKGEAIGAIPADRDNQSIIPDCSSGFRLVSGDAQMAAGIDMGVAGGDSTCVLVVADESTPMTEDAWNRIVDEFMKPRFAFERTYEGHRYTRKI